MSNFELSIVVPIYNGENYIREKLESISEIKGIHYEVIISLNLSTDKSSEIIDALKDQISNLTILRHPSFISGGENLQRGVAAASGQYIFVSAVDDICDKEFYGGAISLLKQNPSASAVAPITQYADETHGKEAIEFELLGNVNKRLKDLFRNIRVSHGIFYSLMPCAIAKNLYKNFALDFAIIGGDWLFDIKLVLEGEIYRTKKHKCVFGMEGVSRGKSVLRQQGLGIISEIFPYKQLVIKVIKLSKLYPIKVRVLMIKFAVFLVIANFHRYIFFLIEQKRSSNSIGAK